MRKTRSKKGFTLAELLIVVAVIAILVAIAIPVFSSQLSKARQAVDDANLRSAASMASADYLLTSPTPTGSVWYTADKKQNAAATGSDAQNMVIKSVADEAACSNGTFKSSKDSSKSIAIEIGTGGEVLTSKWK